MKLFLHRAGSDQRLILIADEQTSLTQILQDLMQACLIPSGRYVVWHPAAGRFPDPNESLHNLQIFEQEILILLPAA